MIDNARVAFEKRDFGFAFPAFGDRFTDGAKLLFHENSCFGVKRADCTRKLGIGRNNVARRSAFKGADA